jgi:predicted ArsR family transcriptional regulator
MSVRELVELTGLHENAVRRNLGALVRRGEVHVEPSGIPRRGRGRPTLRYRAVATPETPYRRVLPLVLALLDRTETGREQAYELGRSEGLRSMSSDDPREAVVSSLSELGFAPVEEPPRGLGSGSITIRLSRCPFADIVQSAPAAEWLCPLHHGLIAGVTEASGGHLEDFAIVNPKTDFCRVRLRRAEGTD